MVSFFCFYFGWGVEISNYLSDEARQQIKTAIKEAGGNEVFFTGQITPNGLVETVKIGSRGNSHTVPVNFSDKRNCSVLIHNHPSGQLLLSDADLNVASEASENGCGFYIINNSATEIYVVVEPVLPKAVKKSIKRMRAAIFLQAVSFQKLPMPSKKDLFR
jgi:ATP-dependent DNA helicase DinG